MVKIIIGTAVVFLVAWLICCFEKRDKKKTGKSSGGSSPAGSPDGKEPHKRD